jgi:cytochrome c551
MIKVLVAGLVGTLLGVAVMVVVMAASGTDTPNAAPVLPETTAVPTSGSSAPTSEPSSSEPTSGGSGDVAAGEAVFEANCASCHVTEPGAPATVGPNLADLASSLDEQTILDQIANGGGAMPAGLVSGQDATDAAAYVLSLGQ